MPAVRLLRWQSEPELVGVPVPEPAGPCPQGRAGAVRAETECFTLGQAVDAYRRLRRGEVRGRAVITPGTSHPPDIVSV